MLTIKSPFSFFIALYKCQQPTRHQLKINKIKLNSLHQVSMLFGSKLKIKQLLIETSHPPFLI